MFEYYDEKSRECLQLTEEEWGLVSWPKPKVATLAGSAAHRLVKEKKKQAVLEQLERVKMGGHKLGNALHFKHLGVLQSGYWNFIVPVNHRIFIALATFQNLRRSTTEKNVH